MKKLLLFLLLFAATLTAVAALFGDRILTHLMVGQVEKRIGAEHFEQLPDGLHVALCGAGSPMSDPKRSGPCTLVIAGKRIFVVDIGSGSTNNINAMGMPLGNIEGLLITHFHSDHIGGIGGLALQRWAGGHQNTPLPVYGPTGITQVVNGFNMAFQHDFGYRVAHHGATVQPGGAGSIPREFDTPVGSEEHIILDDGGLKITAFAVDHAPVAPAVGYRFDYGGRSVLISGDTKPSANLEAKAKGVDLLVHEALSTELVHIIADTAENLGNAPLAKIMRDIPNYHTSPVEAAEIASRAGVKHLLYYHIVPPLPVKPLEWRFLDGVDAVYDGPLTLGQNGSLISLPTGSDTITTDNLL